MSATTQIERELEGLENVMACLSAANDHTRCVLINLVNQVRPDEDHLITELLAARREITKAKQIITGWHPNRRINHKTTP